MQLWKSGRCPREVNVVEAQTFSSVGYELAERNAVKHEPKHGLLHRVVQVTVNVLTPELFLKVAGLHAK